MQDIAGARIVVPSSDIQDVVLGVVEMTVFSDRVIHVKDQRTEPDQWGYRAMHVIVRLEDRLAEIQVRTVWQDRWAQVIERLDSAQGWDLKHGRGPAEWLEWLHALGDELREADLGRPYAIPRSPYDEEAS
jgi:ppGpp synthetase/RelA/SpoT-type nucleotidyltranferase